MIVQMAVAQRGLGFAVTENLADQSKALSAVDADGCEGMS
jgi:hypothetical protein